MPVLEDQTHERFCQLVLKGKSDTAAYMEAYGVSQDSAQSNAWRVREYEGVKHRLAELFGKLEEKTVLSLVEKRRYLADVVRTEIGKVDEHSPLCQSVKYGKDGVEYKMPGKLEALKLDAMLAGELQEKQQGATIINIALIGMALQDEGRDRPAIEA
jgi:hypothetical protein